MKVEAKAKGFFNDRVRNYDEGSETGDKFEISARSDEFIIKNRAEKSDKKVSDAEKKADIEKQFSSAWMVKL